MPFQVSDPEPAPMILPQAPLPGRADFPGALGGNQDAAGDYRSYAEPTAAPDAGMKQGDLKSAEAAVAMAMRFQGMRGFQEDVAAGMPQEQAILKHGPKMFFNTPQSYTRALKLAKPVPEFVPSVGEMEGGIKFAKLSPNRIELLNRPPPVSRSGALSNVQHERIQLLKAQRNEAAKTSLEPDELKPYDDKIEAILREAEKGGAIPNLKAQHRAEGLKLLKLHPEKAAAIVKRFNETYPGEDLGGPE